MQRYNIWENFKWNAIYGNSDFAELIYYYFTNDSNIEVVGFCVDKDFIKSDKIFAQTSCFIWKKLKKYFLQMSIKCL